MSRTQVAFSYAGNIWTANREGSDLRRLTGGGHESKPVFSPDGLAIAFVGERQGVRSVYVMSAAGGEPRRLTYHPTDLGIEMTIGKIGWIPNVVNWTPDGRRILFNSRRESFLTREAEPCGTRLFTIPAAGGPVAATPLYRAAEGSLSPDGTHIAYVPNIRRQQGWKDYRGGATTAIWIVNLADSRIEARVPREGSNDFNPMWVGDTVYFLSDREGPVTLFAYDTKSRRVTRLIRNRGEDISTASATKDAIVYEQLGAIHLLDLESGTEHALDMRPVAASPEVGSRLQRVEPAQISYADISPAGESAVFAAHGELLTASAETDTVRNITRTSDVVERDPAWSPDGRSIAYFSDESGEYALHIKDVTGSGRVRKINLGSPPAFYYSPIWSRDSRKIAYTDQRLNYWYVDLDKQQPVRVDTDVYTDPANVRQLVWSPDSRWIAYSKQLPSHLHAVFVYSLEEARSTRITDGKSDALHIAFDRGGHYLYFTASTDVGLGAGWLDMSALPRLITRSVYAVLLTDGLPSPVGAQPDDATKKTGSSERYESDARVNIDFEGIQGRTVALPIPARNYYDLVTAGPGVLFLVEGPQVETYPSTYANADDVTVKVHRFDVKSGALAQILDNVTVFSRDQAYVSSYHLSADTNRVLYARNGGWFIGSAQNPTQGMALNFANTELYVDPRAEWKHMFQQIWRDERDFFYDSGLHGLDLAGIKKRYEPYLENLSTRADISYLFNEMLGSVRASHSGFYGAAQGSTHPVSQREAVGLLGADYVVENGRYRFQRIYGGDPWNPTIHAPLTQPRAAVVTGEFLLAVNGRDVRSTLDVYGYFEATAGKRTMIKVGATADGRGAREVAVVPVDDEAPLRSYAWVENNRRVVDQLSGGRVAYVYLPDTYQHGYASFNREYFAQVGMEATIVDARYNGGGNSPDYLIDYLRRPRLNYWHMPYGQDIAGPQEAIFGPKVLVVNELTGSCGEDLAWKFRRAGVGPLVGKRTWGGLVGIYTIPDDLLDGSVLSIADLAFYSPDGTWEIENRGVQPDFEVEDDPQAQRRGHDPQLEAAVQVLLERLNSSAPLTPHHPPFPDFSKAAQ